MLIEIARAVRLTLHGSHLQALHPGEIYEVAPAIGGVLIADGWAIEVASERRELWNDLDRADDDATEERSSS